nr:hypothetical protein BaRGS_028027 [Batillaria attramentaria]
MIQIQYKFDSLIVLCRHLIPRDAGQTVSEAADQLDKDTILETLVNKNRNVEELVRSLNARVSECRRASVILWTIVNDLTCTAKEMDFEIQLLNVYIARLALCEVDRSMYVLLTF